MSSTYAMEVLTSVPASHRSHRVLRNSFTEVLPKYGHVYNEEVCHMVICKPKLLPLKAVSLQKLETMQKKVQQALNQAEESV